MNRVLAYTSALAAGLAMSVAAFAQSGEGIGRAGSYEAAPVVSQQPKTRAEVQAELVAAYRDGSLPALNRTSYPEKGLIGRTQAERIAVQENRSAVSRVAQGH